MKNSIIQKFEQAQVEKIKSGRKEFPKFKAGDTVSVKYKISEGATTRLQAFQGVVIAKTKDESNFNATFTVRKISSGVGVERKFALYSPLVDSIEVKKKGVVRRAKLYYLRELTGKAARIKEKLDFATSTEEKAAPKKEDPKKEAVKAPKEEVRAEEAPKKEEAKSE